MKILQFGNPNFGFILSKELRKKGIISDLLISKQSFLSSKLTSVNDPRKLNNGEDLPDWIYFYDLSKWTWKFKVWKFLRKYDIIHCYQEAPIIAQFSGKPYIAQGGGDDFRELPFEKSFKGKLYLRALKKSKKIVYVWPPLKPFLDKLGFHDVKYIPRIWNVSESKKNEKISSKTLIIFHPTGQDWKMKGNDKFLKGFQKACKENLDIFLYYVDWGKDRKLAKKILEDTSMNGKIEIIDGPISREQMISYMNKSDIVADQFNSGSFTRTGIEALKFGIPLLVNLEEKLHKQLHGDSPPVINAKTDEEVYSKLKKYANSKEELNELSLKGVKWSETHYNLEKNVEKFIEIYKKILEK